MTSNLTVPAGTALTVEFIFTFIEPIEARLSDGGID